MYSNKFVEKRLTKYATQVKNNQDAYFTNKNNELNSVKPETIVKPAITPDLNNPLILQDIPVKKIKIDDTPKDLEIDDPALNIPSLIDMAHAYSSDLYKKHDEYAKNIINSYTYPTKSIKNDIYLDDFASYNLNYKYNNINIGREYDRPGYYRYVFVIIYFPVEDAFMFYKNNNLIMFPGDVINFTKKYEYDEKTLLYPVIPTIYKYMINKLNINCDFDDLSSQLPLKFVVSFDIQYTIKRLNRFILAISLNTISRINNSNIILVPKTDILTYRYNPSKKLLNTSGKLHNMYVNNLCHHPIMLLQKFMEKIYDPFSDENIIGEAKPDSASDSD